MPPQVEFRKSRKGENLVRYECSNCRTRLNSPVDAINTQDMCPECNAIFIVPGAKEYDRMLRLERELQRQQKVQNEQELRNQQQTAHAQRQHQDALRQQRYYCPFCQEVISAAALKCKHCGEFFDSELREEHEKRFGTEPKPGVAALLSLVIPGAGQIYRGKIGEGICWLIGVTIGYAMLILPGFALHIFCILDAGKTKRQEYLLVDDDELPAGEAFEEQKPKKRFSERTFAERAGAYFFVVVLVVSAVCLFLATYEGPYSLLK